MAKYERMPSSQRGLPHLPVLPGPIIMVAVLGLDLTGDGLRESAARRVRRRG